MKNDNTTALSVVIGEATQMGGEALRLAEKEVHALVDRHSHLWTKEERDKLTGRIQDHFEDAAAVLSDGWSAFVFPEKPPAKEGIDASADGKTSTL